MRKRNMYLLAAMLCVGGCSTVTINPEVSGKLTAVPEYEDSKSFYFWGLSGEHRVDVKKICGDTEALQMQSQQTLVDGVLTLLTLGIYAPHTVKVWCKNG